ncbi:hypothetical protein ACROYT_G037469 [Oculina patagonica]
MDDSASSSGREKNAKGKRRFKLTRRNNTKASPKNSPTSTPRDDLSITSVESSNDAGTVGTKSECLSEGRQSIEDLAVIGRAIPIVEKPEKPKCDADLEELSLDEESSSTLAPQRVSEEPERSSHLQLLEFLKIRLNMAVNNMEINRLLTSVDRALDRTARTRELGFRRMRAAEEARRASLDFQEETGTAYSHEEETGDEDDEESDEGGGTPPPPIPRVCWQ